MADITVTIPGRRRTDHPPPDADLVRGRASVPPRFALDTVLVAPVLIVEIEATAILGVGSPA
jgi:hypothetical protein